MMTSRSWEKVIITLKFVIFRGGCNPKKPKATANFKFGTGFFRVFFWVATPPFLGRRHLNHTIRLEFGNFNLIVTFSYYSSLSGLFKEFACLY